ncbi:MAG TPA: hypothetical protein VFK87_05565, partial [Steroidobacteraceae bacterium]|nr:hypothetical protein [Steroidobacteraceae bacterium]
MRALRVLLPPCLLALCAVYAAAAAHAGAPAAAAAAVPQPEEPAPQPAPATPAPSAPVPVAPAPAAPATVAPPPATAVPLPARQIARQAAAGETNPDWAVTLERIASSVVSIDIDMTRAFDTEWNATAQATGFVVDAERGLILTNRHVVTPGPVTAVATFLNREEVQLYPVYRDPV